MARRDHLSVVMEEARAVWHLLKRDRRISDHLPDKSFERGFNVHGFTPRDFGDRAYECWSNHAAALYQQGRCVPKALPASCFSRLIIQRNQG